jgi:hypothetical protein
MLFLDLNQIGKKQEEENTPSPKQKMGRAHRAGDC